jgi:hypothetical protein
MDAAAIMYALVSWPEFVYPDSVPSALIVALVVTGMDPEYVVPCVHVPGVVAVGVLPSVV